MNFRVLIAEADEPLLAAYQDYLVRNGLEVVAATTMRACVAALLGLAPDLLVLELELPCTADDGIEFLALMLSESDKPLVPVIALTSDQHAVIPEFLPFPVSGPHVKPVSPEELLRKIRGLIPHGEARHGPAAGLFSGPHTYRPGRVSVQAGAPKHSSPGIQPETIARGPQPEREPAQPPSPNLRRDAFPARAVANGTAGPATPESSFRTAVTITQKYTALPKWSSTTITAPALLVRVSVTALLSANDK